MYRSEEKHMKLSRIFSVLLNTVLGIKKLFTNKTMLRCLNETVSLQQHKSMSYHIQIAKWPLLQGLQAAQVLSQITS